MRIALCLSGQPRQVEITCPHILEMLIKPNGIEDIFIHTWYDKSVAGIPILGNHRNNGVFHPDADQIIISHLNPKKISVEPPRSFEEFAHLETRPVVDQTHLASMGYSTLQSNLLKQEYEKEHGFVYDVVIKTRIDIYYWDPPMINLMVEGANPDEVYVSEMYQLHGTHTHKFKTRNTNLEYSPMSDCVVFGPSKNMDIVASYFNQFEEIFNDLDLECATGEGYHSYITTVKNKLKVVPKPFRYRLFR